MDFGHVLEYRIVRISTSEELSIHDGLADDFFELYQDPSNFPDPDELEEPEFIRERVATGNSNPYTSLLALELVFRDGSRELGGGMIAEYYPDSSCMLITYLFVKKAYRGKVLPGSPYGIAEMLIHDEGGLPRLIAQNSKRHNRKVNAVFFESNNPFETRAEDDSMPPGKRLKFFSRNGAKKVDFRYVQPPLDATKQAVTNLYLLCFPALTGLGTRLDGVVVMRFVMELAKSLDQNKEDDPASQYGRHNYEADREIVNMKDFFEQDQPENALKGLEVSNENVLKKMCSSLRENLDTYQRVALVPIPGAE
jgi:hypothetical protein